METQDLIELSDYVTSSLEQAVKSADIQFGELTINILVERLSDVMTFLRNDPTCRFTVLVDICGVDYPERAQRFDVVYHLLSMHQNHRIRVKLQVDDETPVPSIVELYPTANWYEREAFDMYGILFSDHPDLRRLLTDYGFSGYPLRKDFPLTGHVEVRYDDEKKRVVYDPVSLTQEFRDFDFMSPWEGAQYILPGDEKADDESKQEEA